jgi:predicted nucleic acid-binding protein
VFEVIGTLVSFWNSGVIAATVIRIGAWLLTRNVRHFRMFPDLQFPY